MPIFGSNVYNLGILCSDSALLLGIGGVVTVIDVFGMMVVTEAALVVLAVVGGTRGVVWTLLLIIIIAALTIP